MSAIPNYKDVIDLVKKGMTVEAQEKIMELKEGALELQEENLRLREHIRELEGKLAIRERVVWEPPYYWIKNGDEKDGPYCQHCYDKDAKLIRLQNKATGRWYCYICKSGFTDSDYSPPPSRPRIRSRGIY
jgi:hypothetical protein